MSNNILNDKVAIFFQELRKSKNSQYKVSKIHLDANSNPVTLDLEGNGIIILSSTHQNISISINQGDYIPQNLLSDFFDIEYFPYYTLSFKNLDVAGVFTACDIILVTYLQLPFNIVD